MLASRISRWTPQEDALFRRMAEANVRPEIIAAKLNRSVHAIKLRAYTIGLPLKWFKMKANGKGTAHDATETPESGQLASITDGTGCSEQAESTNYRSKWP